MDELGCFENGTEYNGEQCIFTSAAQLEFHNTFCRKDINNKTKSDKKTYPGRTCMMKLEKLYQYTDRNHKLNAYHTHFKFLKIVI